MSRTSSSNSKVYDKKKFQTIFPQYLDSSLAPAEGRRLTKSQSVQCPTLEEIVKALIHLGYRDVFVDPVRSLPCAQSQARQVPAPRGCVKVAIKEPTDVHYIKKSEFDVQQRASTVDGISSKMEVLRRISAIIKSNGQTRPAPINMTPANQPKEAKSSSAVAIASGKRR